MARRRFVEVILNNQDLHEREAELEAKKADRAEVLIKLSQAKADVRALADSFKTLDARVKELAGVVATGSEKRPFEEVSGADNVVPRIRRLREDSPKLDFPPKDDGAA